MFPRLFSSRLPFSTMRRAKHCLLGPSAFFPFPVSLFSGPDMCCPGLLLRCPVGSHIASEKAKLEGKEFTMRTQPAYPCHFLSEKQKTRGCTFSSQSSVRIYGGPATCEELSGMQGHTGKQDQVPALPGLALSRRPVQPLAWTWLSHDSPTCPL